MVDFCFYAIAIRGSLKQVVNVTCIPGENPITPHSATTTVMAVLSLSFSTGDFTSATQFLYVLGSYKITESKSSVLLIFLVFFCHFINQIDHRQLHDWVHRHNHCHYHYYHYHRIPLHLIVMIADRYGYSM